MLHCTIVGRRSNHNYLLITMISILARRTLPFSLRQVASFRFSGGHHAKPYDWRDDHALNPFFEADPKTIGCRNPEEYEYPHVAEPEKAIKVYPDEYNPKDLTTNFVGTTPLFSAEETNGLLMPYEHIWNEVAHEWDYESEDLDFQPENFKSQHFRKRGRIWQWFVLMLAPFWYVILEVVYNQMVDSDVIKFQRPPPLNYPDEEDTPDTETYNMWKTPEFAYLHDAGLMTDPYFEIIDGKKVYNKWAGVNQPRTPIK